MQSLGLQPRISKVFLEIFFTVGQNNFGNKILVHKLSTRKLALIFIYLLFYQTIKVKDVIEEDRNFDLLHKNHRAGFFFFFKLISGYTRFIRDLRAQSESEIETKEIVLALFAFISMSPELS